MNSFGGFILAVIIIVVLIFVMRWIGAWMLRIDEVIDLQKETLVELRKLVSLQDSKLHPKSERDDDKPVVRTDPKPPLTMKEVSDLPKF
jgi:hypothetical protein